MSELAEYKKEMSSLFFKVSLDWTSHLLQRNPTLYYKDKGILDMYQQNKLVFDVYSLFCEKTFGYSIVFKQATIKEPYVDYDKSDRILFQDVSILYVIPIFIESKGDIVPFVETSHDPIVLHDLAHIIYEKLQNFII